MKSERFFVEKLNYLAIRLLEELGNYAPSQQQIDLLEQVLSSTTIDRRLTFEKSLTVMEKACLYWAAKGMTTEETAGLLKIAASTVETHRNKIKRKLQCKNIAHAVFEGLRYGYIGG